MDDDADGMDGMDCMDCMDEVIEGRDGVIETIEAMDGMTGKEGVIPIPAYWVGTEEMKDDEETGQFDCRPRQTTVRSKREKRQDTAIRSQCCWWSGDQSYSLQRSTNATREKKN